MKILAVGGGSGGHVTPVVAVFRELRRQRQDLELRFWCDSHFSAQARQIMHDFDATLRVDVIAAGKFRRYYHLTVLQHILYPSIFWPNVRDAFLVLIGFVQSFFKLVWYRPDVVFTKGGYVCLPVGLAARLLNIPLVIHESDTRSGLTNRILARYATTIATGGPLSYYPYPKKKSHYVGIPVSEECHVFSEAEKMKVRRQWKLKTDRPLVVVTGGGLGAVRLNNAVQKILPALLEHATVVLVSGTAQYEELKTQLPKNSSRFQLHAFIAEGMIPLMAAADVVIARAGATTLLELAALAAPTILVPNGQLTGGHQLKNAAMYADAHAVILVDEKKLIDQPDILRQSVASIIAHPKKTADMQQRFHKFAKPQAAADMARLILKA